MSPTREAQLHKLEQNVDRLYLITEALWEILKEQHGYDESELFRRISEIDLSDGRIDGRKASGLPSECPHCGRVMIGKLPICQYCGKPSMRDVFER